MRIGFEQTSFATCSHTTFHLDKVPKCVCVGVWRGIESVWWLIVFDVRKLTLTVRSINLHGTKIVSSITLTVFTNFSIKLTMLSRENSVSSLVAIRRNEFLQIKEMEKNSLVLILRKNLILWNFIIIQFVECQTDCLHLCNTRCPRHLIEPDTLCTTQWTTHTHSHRHQIACNS